MSPAEFECTKTVSLSWSLDQDKPWLLWEAVLWHVKSLRGLWLAGEDETRPFIVPQDNHAQEKKKNMEFVVVD